MKVRAVRQGYYPIDQRGPRMVEPGTVFEIPDGQKPGSWMEVIGGNIEPASLVAKVAPAAPVEAAPKARKVRVSDETAL